MKRALIISAVAAGAVCLSAAPAVAGLAGNASFSRHIPVPVPSGATAAQLTDDNHHNRGDASPSATSTSAGDDRGPGNSRGPGEAEPTDDHGGARTSGETEPGDDHGGARSSGATEPGDDRGHDGATPSASATSSGGRGGSDDSGRSGGSGSSGSSGSGGHG